jgi:NAD(P)H-hydrate repair Nnr-like enzyme with NAD(P)H-hydrate dehydratase domain
MSDREAAGALLDGLVPRLGADAVLVLDGAALTALAGRPDALRPLAGRAVLTPHAGEMASALGVDKGEVEADPPAVARRAAARFGAAVALKGADTFIAEPPEAGGACYHFGGGSVGLGTSGSGDTLSGIVAGLAARGAAPATAAVWGVWAHGTAGERLAGRMATVGYLARELLAEVPALVGRGAAR